MMVAGAFVQMFDQAGEIGEKIFVLIAAARGGPFAFAVAAQIQRHRVLDRHAARHQHIEKRLPAPPLIANTVNENISVLLRIAPFPVMKL